MDDALVRAYDQETFSRLRALARDCAAMLEGLGPRPLVQPVGRPEAMLLPPEWSRFYTRRYLHVVQEIIRALAARGRVVIMGRGAQVVLRGGGRALHVRTVAPWELRLRWVMREEGVGEREAARRIRRRDRAVARYLRHFYGVDWTDPLLYHLVINTAACRVEGAVQAILRCAPQEAEEAGAPLAGERQQPAGGAPGAA